MFYFVTPKEAFIDVVDCLNYFAVGSIKTPEAFYKVAAGARRQMYGWRIVKMLTRSEVRKGLKLFKIKKPTAIITYEMDYAVAMGFE